RIRDRDPRRRDSHRARSLREGRARAPAHAAGRRGARTRGGLGPHARRDASLALPATQRAAARAARRRNAGGRAPPHLLAPARARRSRGARQVYRGMDIGTAKPTAEERARIRHHLIDVADPGERYDVLRYQRDGRAALAEVRARGHVALVVGGTGLYVRALLDGLDLASLPHDPAVRTRLESEDPATLHDRLRALDPDAASLVDARNRRRLVRYLEVVTIAGGPVNRARGPSIAALR